MSARSNYSPRKRLMVVGGVLGACCAVLVARAAHLQVISEEFYQQQGDARFLREIPGELLNEVRPRVQVSRPYAAAIPRRNAGHSSLAEKPAIALGASVRHATFGTGIVTDVEGSGAHARVQVNFDDAGSKWLVLAFANLQPA